MTVPADGSSDLRAEPFLRSLGVLVDFANCDELRDVEEPGPWQFFFTDLIHSALDLAGAPADRLLVRLYGGWYEGHTLTQQGSIVSSIMAEIDPFPVVIGKRIIPGDFELALAPIGLPAAILSDTFRRRGATPRLRRNSALNHPTCSMDQECGARAVARWTKSPKKLCFKDGCTVMSGDAFVTAEQKMVDTLLAIDIVDLAVRQSFSTVIVVSDDTDFIPPLIYAASLSSTDLAVMSGIQWGSSHSELLRGNGVGLIERSA